jgi:hypothetical protein
MDATDTYKQPVLWTGTTMQVLSVLTSGKDGYATGCIVSGGVIYVTGSTTSSTNKETPCYWKYNGSTWTRTDLLFGSFGDQGVTWGIVLVGTDVYLSGYTYTSPGVFYPCYWKNSGACTYLGTGGNYVTYSSAQMYGINAIPAPSGAFPVWFVGTYNNGTKDTACYWKDATTLLALPDSAGTASRAYSMAAVDSSTQYATGYVLVGGLKKPYVWKIGGGATAIPLASYGPTDDGSGFGLMLCNGTPYVAGTVGTAGTWWTTTGLMVQLQAVGVNPRYAFGIFVVAP